MMRIVDAFILFISFMAVIGCGQVSSSQNPLEGDSLTAQAQLLSIVDCGAYTLVDVKNPWNEGVLLQQYALVHRDSVVPENLPAKAVLVRVPISSALVYSSVHAGAFLELGSVDAVTGVADAEYYKIPQITDGLKSGKVINVGSSMTPMAEKIVELSPQVILTSPYQNAGYGVIEKMGIPIIACADYMESTPLGRAEWIKFIGELLCKRAQATAIYDNVVQEYNTLAQSVKDIAEKPIVISEMLTNGVWFVPGGKSYMAQMFADAGASYPWSENTSTGSLQLDFATVYDNAYNADYWIIKSFEPNFSLANLESKYPLNKKFEAFEKGNVYVINTVQTTFFEDFPFHPEKLLREYILLFHPQELSSDVSFQYLQQVK